MFKNKNKIWQRASIIQSRETLKRTTNALMDGEFSSSKQQPGNKSKAIGSKK